MKFFMVPFKLVSDKPYALSRNKQDFVREELERLKANGIIRNSDSPFASPILLVAVTPGVSQVRLGFGRLARAFL